MKITQWKEKLVFTVGYLLLAAVFYIWKLPCVFRALFGVVCPGCGMTRAVVAALRLDFAAAFSHHLMFWSIPILYLYIILDLKLFQSKFWNRIVLVALGCGYALNWLLNLVELC